MTRPPGKPSDPGPPSTKQVRQLEDKVRKLNHASDDLRKEIFNASQRGNHLVNGMGFKNMEEAESAMSARPEIYERTFIEQAASRIQSLEMQINKHIRLDTESREAIGEASEEIASLREENDRLKEELAAANRQKDDLRKQLNHLESTPEVPVPLVIFPNGLPTPVATTKKRPLQDVTPRNVTDSRSQKENDTRHPDVLAPSSPLQSLMSSSASPDPTLFSAELHELQKKYQALRQAKERDDAKYKEDYVKWRNFKRWMFDEQDASLSSIMIDGKTPNWKRILKLRKQYVKRGPQLDTPEMPVLHDNESREADQPGTPPTNDLEPASPAPEAHEPVEAQSSHSFLTSHFFEKAQCKLVSPSDTPAVTDDRLEPTYAQGPDVEPPSSPLSRTARKRKIDETPSSETEDDSQAPEPVYGPQSGVRRHAPGNTGGVSAGLSQSKQGTARLSSLPTSPSRRSNSRGLNQGSRRNDSSGSLSPRKSSPRNATTRKSNGAMISTPATRHDTDKENEGSSSKTKRYPKDYSAYKGHGRYAAGASTGKTTLNSLYQIDSAQNGGLKFQFDHVVRNQDQRKHLHADDCECCRDYYESVGPLPPRLHAPLWRSPESTPSKPSTSRPVHKHLREVNSSGSGKATATSAEHINGVDADFDTNVQQEERIAAHRQEISRHRQQWERASTPPGYWNIGFPDTQEADAINERAREMHERKRARVENEASRGGRYTRR